MGALTKATLKRHTVVTMKDDWARIFPEAFSRALLNAQ
jgi:hypothetical protein